MPEGICLKCGKTYAGWALNQREHLICHCGGNIEVWSARDRMAAIERAFPFQVRIESQRLTTESRGAGLLPKGEVQA
jgi:hypothetical protein